MNRLKSNKKSKTSIEEKMYIDTFNCYNFKGAHLSFNGLICRTYSRSINRIHIYNAAIFMSPVIVCVLAKGVLDLFAPIKA
jgi:hypothetical protein